MARWLNPAAITVLLAGFASDPALGEGCKRVAAGQGAAIQKYANSCLERLGVDPAEFARKFNCVDPDVAKPLRLEVDGDAQKNCLETRDGPCSYAKSKSELRSKFPSCDYPAWLDDSCYGDSYVQVIKPANNGDVKAALLCRHKTRFSGSFDDFDDVAMIVHNSKSGETCWFQSENADDDPNIRLAGQDVPGPVCEGAESFWLTPEGAKGIKCVKCHDSGPWMNSRWMRKATQELGTAYDEDDSPYLNSTPPFDQWPVPLFVQYDQYLDSDGDGTNDVESCTSCHKIAAARPDFRTCPVWIKRATGQGTEVFNDTVSTFDDLLTQEGKKEHVSYWMPDDGTSWTKAAWEAKYKDHVKGLIECCEAVGRGPGSLPAGCTAYCPDQQDGKCPSDRWP